MPTDADIVLGIKPAHIATPQELQTTALENQQRAQAVQGGALDLQAKQRDAVDRARIRSVLTQYGGDFEKALPTINQINPELGMGLQKSLMDAKVHTLNYQLLQQQQQQQQHEIAAAQLAGIDSQQKIYAAHMTMQAQGEDASQLPDLWDAETTPKVIDGIRQRAMTLKEQNAAKEKALDDARRQAAQDREDAKAAETARKDAAAEAAKANAPLKGEPGTIFYDPHTFKPLNEPTAKPATNEWEAFQNSYPGTLGKKTWAELTPQQQQAGFRSYSQAKSTADPGLRDLTRQIAEQRLSDMKEKAHPAPIEPGSREDKLANDIAFGKLTLNEAKGMYSIRDREKLQAVYERASELNPNFNAAQFEMGYKFASNPKTQMAIAAVNTVEPNIDKLIALSDKWDRSRYPTLNAWLRSGQFQLGDKRISDLNQLQTIVGDELGPALGAGAATDLKTQLGLQLAGGSLGKEQYRSAMQMIKDALVNRKRGLMGPMGLYGQAGNNPGLDQSAASGKIIITAPDGSKHPFDTQAQADAFKKLAGIK